MSFYGQSGLTVTVPSASSSHTGKHVTPPPSPRLGVFTSYNPSLSPKHNYNPYQSPLKSPTLIPRSIPIPVRSGDAGGGSNGALTPVPASGGVVANGGSIGGDGGPSGAYSTAPTLYSSFLSRTANIISSRSMSESPPSSPKLLPSDSPPLSPPFSSGSPTSLNSSPTICATTTTTTVTTVSASSSSCSSPFSGHLTFSLKHRNDSNNNSNNRGSSANQSSTTATTIAGAAGPAVPGPSGMGAVGTVGVRPPMSVINVSPYKYQLRAYLYPRHITTEHVVFSHRTKVGGRSLYFFSPATRGGLSKPVFTTREALAHMLEPGASMEESDETESPSRFTHLGSPSHNRRRRSGDLMAGAVCTMKRVHLLDPACDLGISVWRGRGPREGLPVPHSPPTPLGPALLVEAVHQREGYAVAAAVGGDILYLMPSRPDLEARTTEICVQDAVIACVGEGIVWYHVKDYTRRKVTPHSRAPMSPKLPLTRRGIRGALSTESKSEDI